MRAVEETSKLYKFLWLSGRTPTQNFQSSWSPKVKRVCHAFERWHGDHNPCRGEDNAGSFVNRDERRTLCRTRCHSASEMRLVASSNCRMMSRLICKTRIRDEAVTPNPHWTRRRNASIWNLLSPNGSIHTARKQHQRIFACSHPVWIGPNVVWFCCQVIVLSERWEKLGHLVSNRTGFAMSGFPILVKGFSFAPQSRLVERKRNLL